MFQRPLGTRRIPLLLAAVCLVWLASACRSEAPAAAPTTDVREYIAEPFRAFATEHRALLGAPDSQPLRESEPARLVQYFDNARLELDPDANDVVLTPLGVWAHETAPQRSTVAPLGIAEAFDRYYAAHGGEPLLGPALGDVILEDERWVRYHANVRLEWDPALPAGRRVQPAQLGRSHHASIGAFLAAAAEEDTILSDNALLTEVAVDAYATLPIVFGGEAQTLVVVVSDLTNGPLDDIALEATLSWGTETLPVTLARTDDQGLSRQTLDLSAVPPGSWVDVTVTAGFGSKTLGETRFRFQMWW